MAQPTKISWCLLTFNRADDINKSVLHNLNNLGVTKVDELIWVDNGSTPYEYEKIDRILKNYFRGPMAKVSFPTNRGVSHGYNAAVALATGSHFLITGVDRIMPNRWLDRMQQAFIDDPKVVCNSIYTDPKERIPDRFLSARDANGWTDALPFEARLIDRKLYEHAGYLRQDYGLYGHEDCEWGPRVLRVCKEQGWRSVTDEKLVAGHIVTTHLPEYHAFKAKESQDPWKYKLTSICQSNNWPYYNPWAIHTEYKPS